MNKYIFLNLIFISIVKKTITFVTMSIGVFKSIKKISGQYLFYFNNFNIIMNFNFNLGRLYDNLSSIKHSS